MVMLVLVSSAQKKSRRLSAAPSSLPSFLLSQFVEVIGVPTSAPHILYPRKSAEKLAQSCAGSYQHPVVQALSQPLHANVSFSWPVSPIVIHSQRVRPQQWAIS